MGYCFAAVHLLKRPALETCVVSDGSEFVRIS